MEHARADTKVSLASRWRGLSAKNRRRIVLGSLFAAAVAARDLMLFAAASSMFALSELAPAPRPHATPS